MNQPVLIFALALSLAALGACERRAVPPNVIPPGTASQAKAPAAPAAEPPKPAAP